MTEFGRELLQVVEIDIDFCTRTYGESPCTASLGDTGVRKCYNSRFTCQDPQNYNRGSLTLRFARNQGGLPKGTTVFPALRSVSTRASEINFSGYTRRQGPLGKRSEVTIQIDDFAYADFDTDKYRNERVSGDAQTDEGGYNPQDRGTFWGKFRRRNPYILGRPLRVREGYVGQDFGDMRTRHYVITALDGPSGSGGVTIKAKDVLDLADNEKAVAPRASRGRLLEAISEDATEFELLGDPDEYPSVSRYAIGSEILRAEKSGGNTFTITARGLDGTDAQAHEANDTVQQCLRLSGTPIYEVARDLLQDFAGVDPDFIPYSDWQAEGERWQAAYRVTRTIAYPEGVTTLLAQLAVFGNYWWWDEVNQLIRYRVNRPIDLGQGEDAVEVVDEPSPEFPDAAHIMKDTARVKYADDERVSAVYLWHGRLNPTEGDESRENYARLTVASTVSDADKYNQERIREIFSPWLGRTGDESIAQPTANRLLIRYTDTPRMLTFEMDAKDATKFDLGDLVEVSSRVITDETGASTPNPMQVRHVEEEIGGHRLKITVEDYVFDARYGFITPNNRPDYDGSNDNQRLLGTYIVDENTLEFSDGSGPYIIF